MAATQLNFALRTSANCKTVHLLGSWDNYNGQLPLSKVGSKAGAWKGTFRFQSTTLKPGQRYWYYYIIDGYHVSHDPATESTVEPTTGRKLNILNVPRSAAATTTSSTKRHSRRTSSDVPKGRALSPSKIVSPVPMKPNMTKHITTANYEAHPTVNQLTSRLAAANLEASDDDSDDSEYDSDDASDVPSLSSSRSTTSRTSSLSSASSTCTCERYGITRKGDRVKLDCGGERCGSSEDSDSCESDFEEEEHNLRMKVANSTRRHGIVVRS